MFCWFAWIGKMIPTSVVKAHDVGESARSAVKLLADSSDEQFVLTSCTHATVRNYVVSQLTTGNAPRPGVLVNMTVANVMSAAQVGDDHYVVSVGTKSADLTTENLLILFTAGHWDSHTRAIWVKTEPYFPRVIIC